MVLKTAFQLSFQDNEVKIPLDDLVEIETEEGNPVQLAEQDKVYVNEIIDGIQREKEFLDDKINAHLVNWRMDRLNNLDAAVLRIAAYEILFHKETPKAVVINEALNLIAKFGDSDSTKYINAVLDKLDHA
jgi:N utilization substance protein B